MTTLNTLEVMREFASIRRGEHPAYHGGSVYNSEYFAFELARSMPAEAAALCEDIERNVSDLVAETGLPERSVLMLAYLLRRQLRLKVSRKDPIT